MSGPASKNEREFVRGLTIATEVSFGIVAFGLYSFYKGGEERAFQVTVGAFLALGADVAFGWLFWKGVRLLIERAESKDSDH